MGKQWGFALGAMLALVQVSAQAVELTPTERQWLDAAVPVLQFWWAWPGR